MEVTGWRPGVAINVRRAMIINGGAGDRSTWTARWCTAISRTRPATPPIPTPHVNHSSTSSPHRVDRLCFPRFASPTTSCLVVIANKLSSFDIATGKSVWKNANGTEIQNPLPAGNCGPLVGNEDFIVAQVDSTLAEGKSFFVVCDGGYRPPA